MHLNPDELIDLAEGVRVDSSLPHVLTCSTCRAQVEELRAAMAAAGDIGVPEPSPLFWGHLSERVREAVAAEESLGRQSWLGAWNMWEAGARAFGVVAAIVAAVGLVVYLTLPRSSTPVSSGMETDAAPAAVGMLSLQPFGSPDDPSLAVVAGLTEQMDPDAAVEAGLTNHVGGIDEAAANLNDTERAELQRLLKEALAKRGA